MKVALDVALNILDEPRKRSVLNVLERQFGISIRDNDNDDGSTGKTFTRQQLDNALTTIFGNGARIVMTLYDNEIAKSLS
jgi:hypothetical protein